MWRGQILFAENVVSLAFFASSLPLALVVCASLFINFIHVVGWLYLSANECGFCFDFLFILSWILNKMALLLLFLSSPLNILVPSLKIKSLYFLLLFVVAISFLDDFFLFLSFWLSLSILLLIQAKVDMTFSTVYYRGKEKCF